jgi:hypothetical protein
VFMGPSFRLQWPRYKPMSAAPIAFRIAKTSWEFNRFGLGNREPERGAGVDVG